MSLGHPAYIAKVKRSPDKSDYSDGRLVADLTRVGYLPGGIALYDSMTGERLLDYLAELSGRPPARRAALCDRLDLSSRTLGRLVRDYSRGMRQKVSLAAALLHDPQVLFLDEPTVGLDPRSARQMKDILIDFCREGKTVFLSTHILEIAERMCTRVAIVNHGAVVAVGTLDQLRAMVRSDGQSLEQIFLQLTGGGEEDVRALLAELER